MEATDPTLATVAKVTADVFGVWLMTATLIDHYFLAGKTLCGEPLRPGLKRPGIRKASPNDQGQPDVKHRCPTCHRLNLERWSKL